MAEITEEYKMLYNLVPTRMSARKFKPDPIPDGHVEKIGVSVEKN